MKLQATLFRGTAPRITPRALPDGAAQEAVNAQLLTGDLQAWHRPGLIEALANPGSEPVRSIFKVADYWLSFVEEVEFARGTIPGDQAFTTYITGLDVPRFTNLGMIAATGAPPYPAQTRPLGVPGPDEAPEAVATIAQPADNAITLVNPGAELGNTVGWAATVGGMVALENGDVPGLNAQTGSWFFGGGAVPDSESYQEVDFTVVGVIGGQGLSLSWWQATGADGDMATMGFEFYSESSVLISSVEAPLLAPDTPLTWEQRTLSTQVPDGAVSARLIQRFAAVTGGAQAEAYIDTIALTAVDYANSFDGSTLAGWTVSPNEGGNDSDKHRIVQIDAGVGWPPPSFYMRCDEKVPYFYRSFSTEKSPALTVQFDWMGDRDRSGSGLNVLLYASASGVGTSLQVSPWGGVRLYTHPSWGSIGASVEQVSSVDLGTDRRYTVTLSTKLLSSAEARLTVTILDTVTGLAVVNAVETTIPVNGGFVGFKGNPASLHTTWWVDNLSVTLAAPDPADGEDPLYTSYVYTFVNDLGQESVPSDASDTVQRNDNATVTVTTPTTVPTGYLDYVIETKRIYRSTTGAGGTVFRFVAEIPLAQADYIDTLRDDQLGEELESQDYDLPPADLRFILALPNGIMVGASGNRLCFAEQDRPHAWPVGYRLTTDTDITGLGNVDNTVIVGTQSWVYAAVGNSPGAYTMSKPGAPFACKSARSVASQTAYGVLFSGPDGLMAARGPTSVVNLTEKLFTAEQWQALDPSTISAATKDDAYFFSWGDAVTGGTYMLDMRESGAGLTSLGMHCSAIATDLLEDALAMVLDAYEEPAIESGYPASTIDPDGRNLYLWDDPTEQLMPYRWRSKRWDLPYPRTMPWARVRARGYDNLTAEFRADGATLLQESTPTSAEAFRLRERAVAPYLSIDVTISGTERVESVEIADSIEELSGLIGR